MVGERSDSVVFLYAIRITEDIYTQSSVTFYDITPAIANDVISFLKRWHRETWN